MWVVAGILLGLVVLGGLVGFHSGPHVHAAAGAVGVVAAAWLLVMAAEGRSAPVLWVLLGADLALSGGLGVMAWSGLRHRVAGHGAEGIEAAEGVAVSDLSPRGVVRVHGEEWSAVSLNGPVSAGTSVQVIGRRGVHLEVWGEAPVDALVEAGGPRGGEAAGGAVAGGLRQGGAGGGTTAGGGPTTGGGPTGGGDGPAAGGDGAAGGRGAEGDGRERMP